MTEQRKQFKFDPDNLAKLEAFIKANHRVKIGVLGSSERRPSDKKKGAPIDAVGLAAVHEFGSAKMGIPPRSFLRSTMNNASDKFKAALDSGKSLVFEKICSGNSDIFLNEVGAKWVRYVHDTFDNNQWPPVKEPYASRKRTNRILIETGAMLRSITHEVEK